MRPRLDLVERFITLQLNSGPEPVPEAGAYVLEAGGKRLRPAILLATSRLLGYQGGDLDVRYGAIVEMIHTASLVHDDIIDSATVRRGRATANHRWGNQLTVLLGDWLYLRAIELALEVADIPAMQTLSFATTQMIEGEILGLALQGTGRLTREQYLEITRRKTAELFAAACALPTHFSPAFASYRPALEEYGRNIGMCFQIVDDILDIVSSQQRLGKPVFSDLLEGKLTLPFILALPHATEGERAVVERVLIEGELGSTTPEALRELLDRHGAVDEARRVADEFGVRAVAALASLPSGPALDALAAAPRFVVEREF
ncbi:MAG: polyprenyl synthetase family protein [Acidobacteriia bacterium]|nr:polyprenyl synthetase family protein [Terriglobia bacterium]